MANRDDFKKLAKQHLKTAEILMDAEDWAGSAYMMGYVLEFALKAMICKTLNLVSYPEGHSNEKVHGFFKSHNFDQLIVVSGASDLFDYRGTTDAQRNWSDFTARYLGEWPNMRYNKDIRNQFKKKVIKDLHNNLIEKDGGILSVISDNKRW